MHVTARRVALCGLLLAFSVICMVLGSVFETNTLFLLAAASYFVGIVIREFGPENRRGLLPGQRAAWVSDRSQ